LYYNLPCPWLQVKCLRYLQFYKVRERERDGGREGKEEKGRRGKEGSERKEREGKGRREGKRITIREWREVKGGTRKVCRR
jgi:hypothetical protein